MARWTIVFGTLLILLGVAGYLAGGGPGAASVTALIPAFVGLPIALLGLLALMKPAKTKLFMHFAVALGLLGFLAAASRAVPSIGNYTNDDGSANLPAITTTLMTIICGVFVVMCVWSFIKARKAMKAAG